ncbi:hypothetical protein EI546_03480 [Aequorivita sp. H23M31]|uniref:DUF5675 domain-containing protein n=1 Tax=Aequorivita ciconiae TaxID=2494375 RepID=A0A410G0P4_9FLAO|nr:DUF5675 family protein [Aequorivita sp. H23M31]QAA80846.1 hypothetical protein EI546_03480 [Aequorivita sp. H23M31]
MELVLERSYHQEGTHGSLFLNSRFLCFTIELPWLGNQRFQSCIPEGTYELEARYSKKFGNHLLVRNVPNRNLILVHPANYAKDELLGCIGPVSELTSIGVGSNSKRAMQKVLSLCHQVFERKEIVLLTIKSTGYEFN